MASIVYADSFDSYASTAELMSSGRFLYTAPTTVYASCALVSGAGRYGGNAFRAWSLVANASSTQSYSSNNVTFLNIPGYTSGSWTTNPFYEKALQFGFWFRTQTTGPTAPTTIAIINQAGGGSTNTVMSSIAGLPTVPWLYFTPASNPLNNGSLTINQFGYTGALVTSSCPININDGNWHWIELCITPYSGAATASSPQQLFGTGTTFWARAYVDQTLVINQLTGGTVGTGGYANMFAGFFLPHNGYIAQTGSGDGNYYDDMIVCVSPTAPSFPFGPRQMACVRPVSDGDIINYIPIGSSDNYSAVNQGYSNTSSYVQSTGYNQEDRYKFPALTYVPQNVNAVISNIEAGNFEPGTNIGISPTMYDGTNPEVVSARVALPQFKYGPIQTIYETDGSGSTWTSAEINAIQFGFKSVQ